MRRAPRFRQTRPRDDIDEIGVPGSNLVIRRHDKGARHSPNTRYVWMIFRGDTVVGGAGTVAQAFHLAQRLLKLG
jgi:hypothetical protein